MSAESVMKPAVHLQEIGQVAITVEDLPRARDFYRDVLGMPLLFEAGTMAFFQSGCISGLGTCRRRMRFWHRRASLLCNRRIW
jgi:catechol 2,3-dioxygenase-like lactoylglutathione lyase family enzyme